MYSNHQQNIRSERPRDETQLFKRMHMRNTCSIVNCNSL
uniref:Uncharacterized protein n=1 Tax=Rhizophora mucronata TaxID=61149 RepID=A0A2P2QAC6_RHIMU